MAHNSQESVPMETTTDDNNNNNNNNNKNNDNNNTNNNNSNNKVKGIKNNIADTIEKIFSILLP